MEKENRKLTPIEKNETDYKDFSDENEVSFDDLEDSDFGDFVKTQKNKSELKCSDYFESGEP